MATAYRFGLGFAGVICQLHRAQKTRGGEPAMARYLRTLKLLSAAMTMSLLTTAAVQADPGEPLGPAFTVTEDTFLSEIDAAPLPNGGVLILWESAAYEPNVGAYATKVKLRAFNGDGTPRSDELVLHNFPSYVGGFSLATNALGQFAIAAVEQGSYVVVRRFTAAGVPLGEPQMVSGDPPLISVYSPTIGLADNGDFAVVWSESEVRYGNGYYLNCDQPNMLAIVDCWTQVEAVVKLRRYVGGGLLPQPMQTVDHAGMLWLQLSPEQIHTVGAMPSAPSLSMAPDGRFTVAWWRNAASDTLLSFSGIYARSYGMNGLAGGLTQWVSQQSGKHAPPSVAINASGAYAVAYQRTAQNNRSTLFARSYSAPTLRTLLGGAGGERIVSRDTNTKQVIIGVDANGNYVVAWDTADVGLQERVVLFQRFSRGGSPLGQPGSVGRFSNATLSVPQYKLVQHPTGQFAVVWVERPVATSKMLKARSFSVP